ncbi:MAG TPA: terminase family protein [Tissierellaceae bacterium]|nr:terminase family protein [Tissierellaceae bacterium]
MSNTFNLELSPKQAEFIQNANSRWNAKVGATQCGKTFIDIAYVIPSRILERKGEKGLNLILGVTKETIERNVLEPMRDLWGDDLVGEINNRNIAVLFGERVYCIGAEKKNQVSKLRGAKFKYVYWDEMVDCAEEVLELLKSRLSLPYSVCDFTGNPAEPTHFVKKFIDSKADVYHQAWTLYDNPFLDPEYIKQLEIEYEGTVFFDRYILGQWKLAEGSIYKKFVNSPQKYFRYSSEVPFNDIMEINVGVDFGGNLSGHSFVASGITYDYEELYGLMAEKHMNADYTEGIDTNELCELLNEFLRNVENKYGEIDYVFWDNENTVLGNSIKKSIELEFPHIKVRPCKKEKIIHRIELTIKLIGGMRFFYTEDAELLKIALQEAVWEKGVQKDTRLDDGTSDIDTLDGFEYSFTSRNMRRFITG